MRADDCLTETLILIYHNEHRWRILQTYRWKLNAQSEANRSICSGQRRGPSVNQWCYIETASDAISQAVLPSGLAAAAWEGAVVTLSCVGVFIYLIVGTVTLLLCPAAWPHQIHPARAFPESPTHWHMLFSPLPPRSPARTCLPLSN